MKKGLATAAVVVGAALMVSLTALGVRAADRALTARMAELKTRTMDALEAMTGRAISYGSISPSFFQSLLVRDLVILDEAHPSEPLLSIRQVRISYSLLRLITSRDPLGAVRELQILNTGFDLDVQRDKDVIDLLSRLTRAGGGAGPFRGKLTGANVRLSVTSHGSTVRLDNLFFEIRSQPGAIAASFRGLSSGTLASGFSFRSNVRAEGTFDSAFTSTDMTIRLLTLQSSFLNASEQTLQVIWKGPSLTVRKIRDRSPVALEMQADLDKGEYTVTFQSERLRADRLVSFSGSASRFAGWLKVPITASGHVTWRAASRSLEYSVDASALLEDQLPVRNVTMDTSFRGTEKEVFFAPLRLDSADGTLQFEGSILFASMLPSGVLTLADLRSVTSEPLSATLALERLEGSLRVQSTHLAIGSVGFDAFDLTVTPVPAGAAFTATASFEGSPREDTLSARGTIGFSTALRKAASEGGLRNIQPPRLTLTAGLRSIPPDKLYHLLVGAGEMTREQSDLAALLGTFSVSADVSVGTDFSTISVDSSAVTITRPDEPGTVISFGLGLDSSHVSLTGFTGTWKGLSVQGGFEGQFGPDGEVAFTTNVGYLGAAYAFTGRYSPALGLAATGSYGIDVAVLPLHNGTTSVKLKADHFPLPVPGSPILVSLDASGLTASDGQWSMAVSSIVLFNVPGLPSGAATVQAAGRLTPTRLDLSRLVVSDPVSTVTGTAGVDITLPADPFGGDFLQGLAAQGTAAVAAASGESYALSGRIKDGALSVSFQFTGSPLLRFGKTAITGSLAGTGTLDGPLASPRLVVTGSLKDGRLGTDPLSASAQVGYTGDALDLSSVNVAYLSHRLTGGAGSLDVKAGTVSFVGTYQGEYFADQLRMSVGMDGHFTSGSSSWPDVFTDGLSAKVNLTAITVAGTSFPAWNINLHSQDGRLAFDGGPGNSVSGWVDPSLAFRVSLGSPLQVNGTASGSIVGDQIRATADFETIELSILNPMLKSASVLTAAGTVPIYHVSAGVATGTLSVAGPVNDPDFNGRLDIVGGGLQSAYSPDEAGPIQGTLVFSGKTFGASQVSAPVGAGRLNATASFTLDHWSPITFDISLATEGQVPVRLRGRFGRLIADGSGTGQVHIQGNDRAVNVTGDLVVSDCRIALGDAPQGKFVPEDVPTVVSVTARTGRRVEFYWPSIDLPVLRTTATPGDALAITYRGDTGAYSIKGLAGVQGGEIYYFDRSFIMRKGSITFDEDQTKFDPWITASAEVREWDPGTGEEVRITLNADSPFSKFSPRFTSEPPRSDDLILAMIGAPIVNRAETQGLGLAALVYTDILSQTWILRPFEQKVRQLLNLDMFSIRTQILQNLLAQKLFNVPQVNPLDNTSVSLGKYLGNDLFLEMLVRLQQPQLPGGAGVPGGGLNGFQTSLQPDLELTLEWTTPFFLLDWSFLPKHPESLFLSDNSLSFNWRFSY